jgi:hypothetical protein
MRGHDIEGVRKLPELSVDSELSSIGVSIDNSRSLEAVELKTDIFRVFKSNN